MAIFRKSSLERLSSPEELDQLMQVTRPRAWIALAALFGLLFAALLWSIFAVAPVTVGARGVLRGAATGGDDLDAVVYVSLDDGRRIQAGMPAKIAPASVSKSEHGMVLGRVRSVDELPSNQQSMAGTLGNDAFAQALAAEGAIVRVVVQLLTDETSAGGYRWTSRNGSPLRLQEGMICDGIVTISEQSPIELLIP